MIELESWTLGALLAAAVINTTLAIACFRWHVHYARNAKLLAQLRARIPPLERSQDKEISVLRFIWDRTCILFFFATPVFLAIAHGYYGLPVAFGTFIFAATWLLMPFAELCVIVNRCEIQTLRILNSKLHLPRNCYVNKTREI